MRDANRLDKYYDEIKKLHKKYCPDWRLGQLLMNFYSWLPKDPYYFEEERFLDLIYEYFVDTFPNFNE